MLIAKEDPKLEGTETRAVIRLDLHRILRERRKSQPGKCRIVLTKQLSVCRVPFRCTHCSQYTALAVRKYSKLFAIPVKQ